MVHLPPHVLAPPQSSPIAPPTSRPVRSTSHNTQTHPTQQRQQQQHIDAAGNDQWSAQAAAEAMVRQARQALDDAYHIYRSTLNEEQTQVMNHSIDTNRIDEYLDVVETYRGLRVPYTTWTDDHPYTRYL